MSKSAAILETIRLKHRREDFCVTEAVALEPPVSSHSDRRATSRDFYHYCRLKKSGFTTFQAIEKTANILDLQPASVTYCGLKDEDGITDQMIALPGDVDVGRILASKTIQAADDSYIEITPYGIYKSPLEIGGLVGNAFRICIRNLPVPLQKRLDGLSGSNPAWFVNYYDTQRFGVPGGPRLTHRIGAALLGHDYETALDLLKQAKTSEQETALGWQGDAEAFFATLEPRLIAFFLSAESSFHWNSKVQEELATKLGRGSLVRYEREGLDFVAARQPKDLQVALSGLPTTNYRRYTVEADRRSYTTVARPTVVQTTIHVEAIDDDDEFPGHLKMAISFFLPSGCYATNVVNQWILSVCNL